MNFEEYQILQNTTAIYPNKGSNFTYTVLGLVGEAGEVAEKVKKLLRDQSGFTTNSFLEAISKELGDVLWYISATCSEFGLSLQEIAEINLNKLQERKARNTLHGNGDNR